MVNKLTVVNRCLVWMENAIMIDLTPSVLSGPTVKYAAWTFTKLSRLNLKCTYGS